MDFSQPLSKNISIVIWKYILTGYRIIYLFIYAELGLCCHTWAFSSCSEWGPLFLAVRRLLIVVASLVEKQGLQRCGLQ